MSADGSIRIDLKLDKNNFSKQVNSVQNDLSKLKGNLTKMVGAVGVAFGGTALINFGKNVSLMATTTESNVGRVEDIFGSASNSITQFAENNSKSLGMSKSAVAKYASTYGNLFSTFTSSQQDNANMTTAYLNATAVVASKTGRTVADVAERMRSGLLGNTEAIEDLGINVNIKTIEITDAFQRMANGRSWEQLNAYEQAQVRQLAILEQATKKYGNTVANNAAFANQQATASVENLKNSLGKLLNTVVVPAIKFFSELAENVNSFVSALFGIDTTTKKVEKASSQNNSLSTGIDNVTSSATKAKKAMGGLLGAFDELNVFSQPESEVETPTQEVPNSPNISVPTISTTQIDKTSEYSNKFEKMGKKVRETLNKIMDIIKIFEPALKGVGVAFITAFSFKFLADVIKKLGSFKLIESAILVLKRAVASFSSTLITTKSPLKAMSAGISTLWKSFKGFMSGLSPFTKFAVGATGFIAVLVTAKSAIKEFALGNKSLGEVLLNIIPVIGVVGTVLTAMLGPVGLLYTAVGVLIGAMLGFNDAQNKLQDEFMEKTFFDGVGIGIETFTDNIKKSQEQNTILNEKIISLGDTVEANGKKMVESKADFDIYTTILDSTGKLTEEQATKMKGNFDTLVSGTKENLTTNMDIIYSAFNDSTKKAGADLGINVGEMTGILEGFRGKFTSKINQLNDEVQPIFEKMLSGQRIDATERKKVEDSANFFAEMNKKTSTEMIAFRSKLNESSKINFESTDEAQAKITELGDTGKELLSTLEESKNQSIAAVEDLKHQANLGLDSKVLTQTAYNELMDLFSTASKGITEGYERDKKDIENSMSASLGAIQTQLEQQISEMAKSTEPSFGEYWKTLGNMFFNAMSFDDAFEKTMYDKVNDKIGKPMSDKISEIGKSLGVSADKELGKQMLAGLAVGLSDKNEIKKSTDSVKEISESLKGEMKKDNKINSPSKVWEEYGQFLLKGLANGITDNKELVINALKGLLNAMTDRLNTFMHNSIDGWKDMYRSMSNATGDMKYNTIIKNVTTPIIPKLAKGAVIPPNHQFMAILGDQTRGVNIETPLATMIEAFKIANAEGQNTNIASVVSAILEGLASKNKDAVTNIYLDGQVIATSVDNWQRGRGNSPVNAGTLQNGY